MKIRLAVATLAFFILCVAMSAGARAQGAEPPLTNASVVKLVRAGFSEKALIAIIRARPTRFDLAPEKLIELKKSRVTEKTILAMLMREQDGALASADWGDDEDGFFNDGGGGVLNPKGGAEQPGGMDIFGSSGGSRGRVRSRNGNGGAENDSQTVGSASVRILKPQAEAANGGLAPKLEKTPTLTNDSIVELVEAGFSEGTIVRRIAGSPVEFDLSPEKLSDLRKRRVGEPVISAMRAAMGDGTEQPARPEKR